MEAGGIDIIMSEETAHTVGKPNKRCRFFILVMLCNGYITIRIEKSCNVVFIHMLQRYKNFLNVSKYHSQVSLRIGLYLHHQMMGRMLWAHLSVPSL